jgi:hypothetical protein
MKDIVIQIGNSDDKLTQREWSEFIRDMDGMVRGNFRAVHFSGGSSGDRQWQNWCWVGTHNMPDQVLEFFLQNITELRKKYSQNSVAVMLGDTKFI